ncbi:MAG: Tetratricopeptide (TPR) repeat [Pelagibacterales bacterium]|nr:Tetratricopeptide (TPR) repeat [Pelagibacterales bacterium]
MTLIVPKIIYLNILNKMTEKNKKIKQILSLAFENHKKNNLVLAADLYKKALKIDSSHEESLYLLGTLNLQQRKYDESEKLFQKALKVNPNHLNVKHNLAYIYLEIGKHEEAKKLFKEVLEVNPNHLDANYNLGNTYKFFGESEKAEKFYKKAIKINPNNPKAFNNLGNILKDLGKFNEAIDSYKKAIHLQSNHANAYHNLANTYKQLGEFNKAINYYEKSLKHQPLNLETFSTLTDLKKDKIDSNLKIKIEKIMKEKKLSQKDIAYGNFLLSKHEYQNESFEKEFNYLLKAHSHYYKYAEKRYDRGVKYWLDEIPNNKELFDIGKSNSISKETNNEIKPIFIVGVPRCGSTMIEKVIASGEKNISIGEETAIISFYVGEKMVSNESFNSGIHNLKESIIQRYKQRGFINKDSDYIFTDKSLDNFFFIGLIKKIFPNAKIINCKRKPIASIISILKNNLGDVSWAHNIEHIFKFFDIYHRRIKDFKELHPGFIYDLQLEDFVKDPETESKKLMSFCDLPWNKKCLEFYKRKDLKSRTASNIQIRQPIYKNASDKHLPYKNILSKYGHKYNWFN